MMNDYRTVIEEGTGEIEVKKSRFLSVLCHVSSTDEAEEVLKNNKKKYYDASHSCSAYILNSDAGVRHSSDDGEPSGTAGKPILDVLSGAGLSDSMIIVTRYFGGTLLGTGGLVRAYSAAAAKAIENAVVVDVKSAILTKFSLDYTLFPKLDHIAKENDIDIASVEYLDVVNVSLLIGNRDEDRFYKELTEATAGRVTQEAVKSRKECVYYMKDLSPVFL